MHIQGTAGPPGEKGEQGVKGDPGDPVNYLVKLMQKLLKYDVGTTVV